HCEAMDRCTVRILAGDRMLVHRGSHISAQSMDSVVQLHTLSDHGSVFCSGTVVVLDPKTLPDQSTSPANRIIDQCSATIATPQKRIEIYAASEINLVASTLDISSLPSSQDCTQPANFSQSALSISVDQELLRPSSGNIVIGSGRGFLKSRPPPNTIRVA